MIPLSGLSRTLRVLDIERSRQVTDRSVPLILSLKNLVDINVFQTGFDIEGLAKILTGLPNLRRLQRGDFLADVCEHMEELGWIQSLELEDFWASEEYYFHTTDQMQFVAKFCPRIKTMLFMFQNISCSLTCLMAFQGLEGCSSTCALYIAKY